MPRKKDANGKEIRPPRLNQAQHVAANVVKTPMDQHFAEIQKQATTGKLPQYYVFTLNNYTEEQIEQISAIIYDEPQIVYYIDFGVEIGADGTPHLQGQLECNEPSMKKIFIQGGFWKCRPFITRHFQIPP